MFDGQKLDAGIKSIRVKVKTKDGISVRKCTLVLACTFDEELAGALGPGAKKALKLLKDHDQKSCILGIDKIEAEGRIEVQEWKLDVGALVGVKAKAESCPDPELDFPPTIHLEFEFVWNEASWVFFGRHVGDLARVTLRDRQQVLRLGGGRGASA